jgi:hypothetical protein
MLPPYPSFFRFLLPIVTLPLLMAMGMRSWLARAGTIALLVVLQYWWLGLVLTRQPPVNFPA